jgi:hypothetical protein
MAVDGALSGDYVMGGDYLTSVAGSAADQSTPALARLIGTFTGNTAGSFVHDGTDRRRHRAPLAAHGI